MNDSQKEEYYSKPTFVKNLVQLKKPMKIKISETNEEHTALFPINSVMFVDHEVANRWTKENKARIIGLSKKEHRKLKDQLEEADFLDLFSYYDISNFVKGDNKKAKQLKTSLGLEDC